VSRSTDGGATWSDVSAGLPTLEGPTVTRVACGGTTCFVLLESFDSPPAVYRLDAGSSRWSRTAVGIGDVRAMAAAPDGTVYVATDRVVHRTAPAGGSWSSGGAELPATLRSLAVDTEGAVYAGTSAGLFASGDGGETWERVTSPYLDAAIDVVALHAAANGVLTVGTSAGVVRGTPLLSARVRP
jgi:photosystem II stability/assembly factor-like uncharacterized protein